MSRYTYRRSHSVGRVGIILGVIILGVLIGGGITCYRSSETTTTITVKNKERVATKNNGYYLVFTNNEVFCVKDSFAFVSWDASDRYNSLDPGKTYRVRVAGWRIKFFSLYRNILEIQEEINK